MAAPQRCPILALSSIYADILCRGTTELDVVAHVRERLVSCGQPRLTSEENEFQRSPNLGFSRIYTYTLYYRTAKFGMVTHMSRGGVFSVSHVTAFAQMRRMIFSDN